MLVKKYVLLLFSVFLSLALISCDDEFPSSVDIIDTGNGDDEQVDDGDDEEEEEEAAESQVYEIVFSIEGSDDATFSFKADMTDATFIDESTDEEIAFDPEIHNIFIAGSMIDWPQPGSNEDFQLTQPEEGQELTPAAAITAEDHDYKYFIVIDEATWDLGEWPGDPNRSVTVEENGETVDEFGVQPSDDGDDEEEAAESQIYEIVFSIEGSDDATFAFRADMTDATFTDPETEEEVAFDPEIHKVFIAGSMIDWPQPGTNEDFKLTQAEEGQEAASVAAITAEDHEYKYFIVIDEPSWDLGEWTGDPNRSVTVEENGETVDDFGVQPS